MTHFSTRLMAAFAISLCTSLTLGAYPTRNSNASSTEEDEEAGTVVFLGAEAKSLQPGVRYVLYNRGRDAYAYAQSELSDRISSGWMWRRIYPYYAISAQSVTLDGMRLTDAKPYIVEFEDAGSGKVYIKTGTGQYYGRLLMNGNLGTNEGGTATAEQVYSYGKVSGTDDVFWFSNSNNGFFSSTNTTYYMDCNDVSAGPATIAGWLEGPTSTGSNSAWTVYEVNEGVQTLVESVTLDRTALKMPIGSTFTIHETVLPEDASRKKVTWSSSNPDVATISQGLISALTEGTTTLTASAQDASGLYATCTIQVYKPEPPAVQQGDTLFVFQTNGAMNAFPLALVARQETDAEGTLNITLPDGTLFAYPKQQLDHVTTTFDGALPELTSYKFNDKFNDQLLEDAEATPLQRTVYGVTEDYMPDTIRLYVRAAIGKRLTASFKTSTDDAGVYIDGVEQQSKVTRNRFDGYVDYVVAPYYYKVYAAAESGSPIYDLSDPEHPEEIALPGSEQDGNWKPYGRHYAVHTTWASDSPTAKYGVPVINIKTEDFKFITSKTTYKQATISIDGAGVYDDMAATDVQIKGRGNSSWSTANSTATGNGNPKNPYRLKFAQKQKVLGLKGGKNWVLLANKQTGSMTTNALAMKVADMVESPSCNHIIPVELYINGDYRGSYNLTEKIGFSNNSIDLVDEDPAILLQLDSYYDETYKFRDTSYKLYTNLMRPDLTEETDAQVVNGKFNAIQKHFNNFTSTLYKGTSDYDQLMDIDAYTRSWLVTDLTRNCELKHPKSWFVYNADALVDNGDGTFDINTESPYVFGPVWDFDWAFGYDGTSTYFQQSAEKSVIETSGYGTPFFRDIRQNSHHIKKAYYSLWKKFMENGQLDELLEYCDDYLAFVQKSLQHNATVWTDGNNYAKHTTNAKVWLKQRAEWIYSNLDIYDLSDEDILFEVGDINMDGAITTADLVALMTYLDGTTLDNFQESQADLSLDGRITSADMDPLWTLLLQQKSGAPHSSYMPMAQGRLHMDSFWTRTDDNVTVPAHLQIFDGDYCGLQFDLALPEGCSLTAVTLPEQLQDYDITYGPTTDGMTRVSLRNTADATPLPVGTSTLQLTFNAGLQLDDTGNVITVGSPMLVNTDASDRRLAGSICRFSMATQIRDITPTAVDAPLYDLQGRRVLTPAKGQIYIQNGKKVVY